METIVIADEEKAITDTLVLIFRAAGYRPVAVYNINELLTTASATRPDVVLMDIPFDGVTAIDTAIRVRAQGSAILLMSAFPDTTEVLRQVRERDYEEFTILPKPTHPTDLLNAVRQALDTIHAQPKARMTERAQLLQRRSARLLSRGKELREVSDRLLAVRFSRPSVEANKQPDSAICLAA